MKKMYLGLLLPFCIYGESLVELIDLSLHNQLVQSKEKNIDSINSQYKSVQNAYLPKVTLGATYSNTNNETANTPNSSVNTYVNVNYIVYEGGKKSAVYDSFKNNISSAQENLQTLKNDLSLQVINHYFNYYSYVAQKEAKQKEIEQLKAQYRRLVRFLDAGTTTSDEVDKIIARVENANVALHESELNIQTVLHNLKYLVSQDVTLEAGSIIEENSLLPTLQIQRPDIKALEYDMKTVLSNARATKSANYPMLSLDNTYNNYDMNYDNASYQSSTIESQNIFKVNLSWNIFDFGSTTDAYMSEYQKYQSIKSNYEYEKNKANVDLKLAIKSYEISKLKINSAKLALKASVSTYETIEQKYQNGLVDNIAYLEALSEKYNSMSFLKKTEYDLEIKKANIIYYSGKNVWEYVK
jgi:outer membrane protein